MAYNKHTWEQQELITDAKLNNIEDGIFNLDNALSTKQQVQKLTEGNLNNVALHISNYMGAYSIARGADLVGAEFGYPTDDIGIWLFEIISFGSRGLIRAQLQYNNRNFITSIRSNVLGTWNEVGSLNDGSDIKVNSISYSSGGVNVVTEYGGEV